MRHAKLVFSMRKLTELLEWALPSFVVMPAHLGLILGFQGVKLSLVSIYVVVVRWLHEIATDFTWALVLVFLRIARVQLLLVLLSFLKLSVRVVARILTLSIRFVCLFWLEFVHSVGGRLLEVVASSVDLAIWNLVCWFTVQFAFSRW